VLRSTIAVFGAAAVPRGSEAGDRGMAELAGGVVADGEAAPGVVVVAGCANTGAAIVKARMPTGTRIDLSISNSYFWRQVAVAPKNDLLQDHIPCYPVIFLKTTPQYWVKPHRTVIGRTKFHTTKRATTRGRAGPVI
jgi:hypothetical protein